MNLKERLKAVNDSFAWIPAKTTETLVRFNKVYENETTLIVEGVALSNGKTVKIFVNDWEKPIVPASGKRYHKLLPNFVWPARSQGVEFDISQVEEEQPELLCVYDLAEDFKTWRVVNMEDREVEEETSSATELLLEL